MSDSNSDSRPGHGDGRDTGEVRNHELPDGGLAVVEEFCGHVNHAVTVSAADRALYELLIEIFAESYIRSNSEQAAREIRSAHR